MKTFVLLAAVFVLLHLAKCFNFPGLSEVEAQPQIWPNYKYKFPYPTQSPVDVILADAERRKLPALNVQFPWQSSKETIEIENTGYFLEILLPPEVTERPYITGGPLFGDTYIFEQFHFHWGQTNACGSEHQLSGKCFPTEVHVVFYKKEYGSSKEAVNHFDGLAVVAFFGELTRKDVDNPDLKNLIAKLPLITEPNTSTKSSFKTEFLFLKDLFDQLTYYTYPGSLTTPAYSECVTWIICPNTFDISTRQVDAFRRLRGTNGNYLRSNMRELQDFNGRPLIGPSR